MGLMKILNAMLVLLLIITGILLLCVKTKEGGISAKTDIISLVILKYIIVRILKLIKDYLMVSLYLGIYTNFLL